jgi:hypothetical protein
MATPLTATHRMDVSYFVSGELHHRHEYCKKGTTLFAGHPSVVLNDGTTEIDWRDAAQRLTDKIGNWSLMDAHPTVALEERSGSVWNPVDFYTSTTLAETGTLAPASQLTVVLRDTSFEKLRVTLMEGRTGYVGHSPSGLGINTEIDNVVAAWTTPGSDDFNPFNWAKSRGDRYLLSSGTCAGATLDLNDKLKRRRGLE